MSDGWKGRGRSGRRRGLRLGGRHGVGMGVYGRDEGDVGGNEAREGK